jgi:hypothetical protein
MAYRKRSDYIAENVALRAELARVYRALVEANTQIFVGQFGVLVKPHAFGEYLLRTEAA